MTKESGSDRPILVPDDDGTASASFPEEAKGAASRISKDQPIDVVMARALVLSRLEEMEGFRQWLRDLADLLPVSNDRDAMCNDLVPCDEAEFLFGALDDAAKETLPTLFEGLRRAATVTEAELIQDFFDRHEQYLAEQKRRLGRRS
jgi:hypothetical protein